MSETASFTFPRAERLKSKKIIDALFDGGLRTKAWPLTAKRLEVALPEPVPCQVMMSVSKRSFKRAVDRNRIKRLMREAWRLQKNSYLDVLREDEKQWAIVFIYVGKELPTFDAIQQSMGTLLLKFMNSVPPSSETSQHD